MSTKLPKKIGRFSISTIESQKNTLQKSETKKRTTPSKKSPASSKNKQITTPSKKTLASSETKKQTTPSKKPSPLIYHRGRFTVIQDVSPRQDVSTGKKTPQKSSKNEKSTTKTITVSKKELSDLVCSMQTFLKHNKLNCE